jgi:hypothetical protein
MRTLRALALVAALSGFAGPAGAVEPRTLEDCYMQVALQKGSADLVYLAREICDAVFRRFPRALTVQDAKTGECSEWWFDEQGRYETTDRYCALEDARGGSWKLACQWKKPGAPFTFVELRENGGRYEPVGPVHGTPVGALFSGLAACVEARVRAQPAAR